MGHVTEKTLERIAEQKKHIEKIKALSEFIGKCDEEDEFHFSDEDIDIIKRALACHWSVIQLDISRQEEALENGSEDGDLRSQSEKHILEGCVDLINEAVAHAKGYLDFREIDQESEEDKYGYSLSYQKIVNRLFMWNTSHSGGTSTCAKCRELGVDPGEEIDFASDFESWEDLL